MKALILYYSSEPAMDNFPVPVGDRRIFIRAEEVEAENLSDALLKASPRAGERMLNSISAEHAKMPKGKKQ